MCFVAWGVTGFGDLIWETERGRPLAMSTVKLSRRDSRRLEDEECFSRDECLDEELLDELVLDEECLEEELLFEDDLCEDEDEDLSLGTSRMFKTRPVVGSVVDDWEGSWETWYPSMM
jgi:hypothetical protein